ncbi:bZIP transcription factor [Aspergillus tanneri]|uniref:BZIP domain-containing protein n=1 Tax=Aspergillus tanneri TaxID=1220188 RepID=A0A5M9MR29_9EURO|nr:uncharacterized protein ATNIH1004_006526 [Aspergillus tanneri]KAA8647824.1 hypothetical protein ATNIH1004_006526 [Aspergillus tanneri]
MKDVNTERTLRLRENKRRNRARQKEYAADLERRLRQFEQEGVRATIEIQCAAKKVAEENIYLRELLLAVGIDCSTVNDWITRRRTCNEAKDVGRSHYHGTAIGDSICNKGQQRDPSSAPLSRPQCSLPCDKGCQCSSPPLSNPIPKSADNPSAVTEDNRITDRFCSPARNKSTLENRQENGSHDAGLPPSTPGEGSFPQPSAPCKLLTRLATNPGSDVSMILAGAETEQKADSAEGGLSCDSAYKLLMRYATSDEKIEALALSLEEGCVPNSGGGCKVKNETLSQALLDICL